MVHMPKISGYLPADENKYCADEESNAQRSDILARQKVNTFFYTIKQTFMFMSGPLIGAGLGLFLSGMTGDAESPKEMAKLAKHASLGLQLMGGAAIATTIALAANIMGAQVGYAADFDKAEIQAKHIGKEVSLAISKEMAGVRQQQNEQAFTFDNHDAGRDDGKSWLEAENMRRQAANQNKQAAL